MADKWIFATKNPHKLSEVQDILQGQLEIDALPAHIPEAPEPYESLYDNALFKAAFYESHLKQPVIVEDSGLFVPSLGGRPGVHSARFGGPDKLLEAMRDMSQRDAYFVAVMVAYYGPCKYTFAQGIWHGRIARVKAGSGGFGYDPVFIPDKQTATVAELGVEWKLRNSHRARALHRLLKQLSAG
ncbi:MAG: RdgB/HAM1 family non-canonical purine NTP pyrophosphatase [Bacteroidia bacterium]|nr:RdgB/HAM1 family non-canonical purine NTP pyrophosphatase [Bacteroidia bacterium]MCX7651344.1 RdgB/HAM1 family non-canonical purine NTP pyrophosphatase [Bacteroidia bacterium]MDW8417136.1 RdgB/HAM1 family non-canonical purine NTP pyrophosphatase [Bacteroidia bacterium]